MTDDEFLLREICGWRSSIRWMKLYESLGAAWATPLREMFQKRQEEFEARLQKAMGVK